MTTVLADGMSFKAAKIVAEAVTFRFGITAVSEWYDGSLANLTKGHRVVFLQPVDVSRLPEIKLFIEGVQAGVNGSIEYLNSD